MSTSRIELLKKIQARKDEKRASEQAKWARMRSFAASNGGLELEGKLARLIELCAAQTEAFENLKANLDLVSVPKDASLKVRVASARNYAKSFQRIADESPEMLAEAVQEAYSSLDEIAGTLEMAAQQLGVDLTAAPAEETFGDEGTEREHEEAPVDEEIKEGAGEWFSTDRDDSGNPKTPEKVDVPRVANSGPGAAGFVTDRSNTGKPASPPKAQVPQVEGGSAQTSIKDASRRGSYIYRQGTGVKKADDGAASAESFVKDIPQSQGKTEVGAGKAGNVRPMKQIVPSGTPTGKPAEEFVKNIPQAQGKGETPGNKAAGKR